MGLAYDQLITIIKASIDSAYIPDIVEGVVVDDNPITVEIDKNMDLLDVDFLIIPEHLIEHDVEVEFKGEPSFSGTMTVKSGLKVGDPVLMMRCLKGQRYLILDRL